VSNADWARSHWETLRQAYRRAPYFHAIAPKLEAAYQGAASTTLLSCINEHFLRMIADLLGIETTYLEG